MFDITEFNCFSFYQFRLQEYSSKVGGGRGCAQFNFSDIKTKNNLFTVGKNQQNTRKSFFLLSSFHDKIKLGIKIEYSQSNH